MSDPGHEHLVDNLLAHLETHSDNDLLRELAAGIRHGGASLADSVAAPVYAEALQPHLEGFLGWYEHLSESERAGQATHCQSELDHLNRALHDAAEG